MNATIGAGHGITARLHVEAWGPDYGSPLGFDDGPEALPPTVDVGAEGRPWEPVEGRGDHGVARIAIVDGVRRVEARLTLDDPVGGPAPGVLGAWAVGAAEWDVGAATARVGATVVGRALVVGEGREWSGLEEIGERLGATLSSVPTSDPAALVAFLQSLMRGAETELARELVGRVDLVLADGPLRAFGADTLVGYVKTQRVTYLPPDATWILRELHAGERTPLFSFGGPQYPRWSWYLRLAEIPGGHSWSGIARLECSGGLSRVHAARLADATAQLLPRLAPPLHVDPRAPQNLVPIGALESRLRHLLGDPALAWRRAREVASSLGRVA